MEPAQGEGMFASGPALQGFPCPVLKRRRPPQVAEEVLSVLRLLSPLADPEWSLPEPPHGQNRLDVALTQLQSVARKLAMSHATEVKRETALLIARRVTREECWLRRSSDKSLATRPVHVADVL